MQVVCESTQSTTTEVQVAGFECLVRIMQLYYDKMRFYMEKALFGVRSACRPPVRWAARHLY
jgi:importin subunit beta-1